MILNLTRILTLFISIILLSVSCKYDEFGTLDDPAKIAEVKNFDADITLQWYDLYLQVNRYAPGYSPPAASRLLGYVGLAAYEAVVPGMPDYQSLSWKYTNLTLPQIEDGKEYHWPTVLNNVYYHAFKKFYPHIEQAYVNKMESLDKRFKSIYGLKISKAIIDRSAQRGNDVAEAIYFWSQTDALGHFAFKNPQPSDYNPPKGPGKWQPTPPDFGKALMPYWGKVRPFALNENEILGASTDYWVGEYSEQVNSKFYDQALEVYNMSTPVVPARQWIAEFWSDDIFEQTFEPSARWISIANQVIRDQKPNLETTVYLHAKLGMALCDAAIAVWNTKYTYNVERPVSYIQRLIDLNWTTGLNNKVSGFNGISPSFPSYPSDHAGFGAAATGVFKSIFGSEMHLTDKSHEFRIEFNGTPRSFNSFDEMATENAISRMYLGVHYRMDIDEGIRLGNLAAEKINGLSWLK